MRHLAWLHATPEGSKKSRMEQYKALDENSNFLKFPEVSRAEYLVYLLFEAGLVSENGMSVSSLSWQEIESWLNTTQLNLTIWEKLCIKQMSEAYAGEYNRASDKNRSAPYVYVDEELRTNRELVASKLLTALRSFKRKS